METTEKQRLKIAVDGHVLLEKEKTGVGWTAKHLIDEMAKNQDVDLQINFVDILGYRCRDLIRYYRKEGCRVQFCWWLPYSVFYKTFNRFSIPYHYLFGQDNDITIFFDYQVPYGVGTKAANYVHDVNYKVYPETMERQSVCWLDQNLQKFCDRSDVVIAVSEFTKTEIEKYLNVCEEKIRVVPNGVDITRYNNHCSDEQIRDIKNKYHIEGDYILFLGTLEPRKNIKLLLEAYQLMIKKRKEPPKLVIAGKKGWLYDHLFQTVADYHMEDKVVFPGYIEMADCAVLLTGAEMFVFPSLYEGFGIPPLEAMACGTPVVVSDAASLPEVVGDGALLFQSGNANDLCNKICQVLDDQILRRELSVRGLQRARDYTWKSAGEKLVHAIKKSVEHC